MLSRSLCLGRVMFEFVCVGGLGLYLILMLVRWKKLSLYRLPYQRKMTPLMMKHFIGLQLPEQGVSLCKSVKTTGKCGLFESYLH